MKVLNFGSINIDYVYRVPHFVRPGETLASDSLTTVLGGKGANQAIALARAGVQTAHLGRVSAADTWAVDLMRESGVDVATVSQIAEPSGHAIIQVDDAGENAIVLFGGANRSFSQEEVVSAVSALDEGDWLLMQNECNGVEWAIAAAAERKVKIAFNPAPMTEDVKTLPLQQVDLLILNAMEACDLAETADADAALQALASKYPNTTVVVTLGGEGALVMHGGEIVTRPADKVTPVDTTGAGDTFVGYFLASLISGYEHSAALARAVKAAGIAVTRPGASPSIPTAQEVD
ncbi:ribokinase [Hahella sp. NBU794]|uniref:ribokinase n=1 Tax=Hahella sp. NBU794 TaxID=3422590 RepID=UPI003D70090F